MRQFAPDKEIDRPLMIGQGADEFDVQGDKVLAREAQAEGRAEARVLMEKGARDVFDGKPLASGAYPGMQIGILRGSDL